MQSACTLSMRTEIGSTMGKKISYTDEEVKSRLSCFVALCNNILVSGVNWSALYVFTIWLYEVLSLFGNNNTGNSTRIEVIYGKIALSLGTTVDALDVVWLRKLRDFRNAATHCGEIQPYELVDFYKSVDIDSVVKQFVACCESAEAATFVQCVLMDLRNMNV